MEIKIELFKTAQGWMSKTNDPKVMELFGTDTLPTAFTAQANVAVVLTEISRLNPTATVEVR